jgi:hypothetical protein
MSLKIYMPKFRLMAKGEPEFAGIGAIFNAINLRLAREELKKSNHFNKTENTIKFDNAVAGLVASVAQHGGATIKGLENGGVKLSAGWLRWGHRLELAGRYGGAVVGLVSTAIDFYHAWDERAHGNVGLSLLYGASGLAGLAFVIATVMGSILTLPLLVLAAIIGVLINYAKGPEAQDWLEQCYLGIKADTERFERLEEDKKAFSAIFS